MRQIIKRISYLAFFILFVISCSISYKFNGASIDYTKTKTISMVDFPIRARLVYPPLAIAFNEGLKDLYTQQTRLNFVRSNGDISLEGEITRYDLTPQAVQEDAYAAQTRLTVGVRVRFTNKANPEEDFEETFSAYRDFDSSELLTNVQDQLIEEIVDELTETIFNATVANW